MSTKEKSQNVRVVVRIRPLIEREAKDFKSNSNILAIDKNSISVKAAASTYSPNYAFDGVFPATVSQEEFYNLNVKPVVKEVLEGYNCTIFAYGQTGTGKTYTMEGDISNSITEYSGMIPRAIYNIFSEISQESTSIKISHLEIYNEELCDLLAQGDLKPIRLVTTPKNNERSTSVFNLEEIECFSPEEVFQYLSISQKARTVAATKMNDHSSRSHSIFTITVTKKIKNSSGEDLLRVGKLNLVDLAGAENIGRSGAVNERAREAGNINTSLVALGRVVTALAENSSYVPYRDSKLTRILSDSLGGRAMTTLIATVTPAADSTEETISTLNYALRTRNVKNKPKINQTLSQLEIIKERDAEIAQLKEQLRLVRAVDGVVRLSEEEYSKIEKESLLHKSLMDQLREANSLADERLRQLNVVEEHNAKLNESLSTIKTELYNEKLVLFEAVAKGDKARSACVSNGSKLRAAFNQLEKLTQKLDSASSNQSDIASSFNALKQRFKMSMDSIDEVSSLLQERSDSFHKKFSSFLCDLGDHSSTFISSLSEQSKAVAFDVYSKEVAFSERFEKFNKAISQNIENIGATSTKASATVNELTNNAFEDFSAFSMILKAFLAFNQDSIDSINKLSTSMNEALESFISLASKVSSSYDELVDQYTKSNLAFNQLSDESAKKAIQLTEQSIKSLQEKIVNELMGHKISIIDSINASFTDLDKSKGSEDLKVKSCLDKLGDTIELTNTHSNGLDLDKMKESQQDIVNSINKLSGTSRLFLDEQIPKFKKRIEHKKEQIDESLASLEVIKNVAISQNDKISSVWKDSLSESSKRIDVFVEEQGKTLSAVSDLIDIHCANLTGIAAEFNSETTSSLESLQNSQSMTKEAVSSLAIETLPLDVTPIDISEDIASPPPPRKQDDLIEAFRDKFGSPSRVVDIINRARKDPSDILSTPIAVPKLQ